LTVAIELGVGTGECGDYGLRAAEPKAGQPKNTKEKVFRAQLVR
jgi:hypothetical protein